MKRKDIERLSEDGFITADQQRRIIEFYKLGEKSNYAFTILCLVGAILIGAGITLWISANWESIHRGFKIGGGLALMLGAYGAGFKLRDSDGNYPRVGEAFYFLGACLFLSNVALIGQVYHLSSHPQNALLLWLVGIGGLPWLLRSKPLLVLFTGGFWFWWIWQLWAWIEKNNDLRPEGSLLFIAALTALAQEGAGRLLEAGRFAKLGSFLRKSGQFALTLALFILSWLPVGPLGGGSILATIIGVLTIAALMLQWSAKRVDTSPDHWPWIRLAVQVGPPAVFAMLSLLSVPGNAGWTTQGDSQTWMMSLALAAAALTQIRISIFDRSPWSLHLNLVLILGIIAHVYVRLIASMAFTGTLFVVSGVAILGFGWLLEWNRRRLMGKIREPQTNL